MVSRAAVLVLTLVSYKRCIGSSQDDLPTSAPEAHHSGDQRAVLCSDFVRSLVLRRSRLVFSAEWIFR